MRRSRPVVAPPPRPAPARPHVITQREEVARHALTVLPADGGLTPRELRARIGEPLCPGSVCAVLLDLVRAGLLARDGEPGRYRYRRVA